MLVNISRLPSKLIARNAISKCLLNTNQAACASVDTNTAKTSSGYIPIKKLIIESCRSSGPGGQHVNKKNTKVSVSFHLSSADWLPEETRLKLSQIHKANLNKDGYLTIRSDKTRSQTLNIADCMDKLRAYISEAEQPPELEETPETIELKRQRLERASAERLKSKRINGTLLRQARESVNVV